MPKGVEHSRDSLASIRWACVQLSVMPKGVEHPDALGIENQTGLVQLSVMPKGVEHCGVGVMHKPRLWCNYQ